MNIARKKKFHKRGFIIREVKTSSLRAKSIPRRLSPWAYIQGAGLLSKGILCLRLGGAHFGVGELVFGILLYCVAYKRRLACMY